jgi:glycerophosphoryl diester phosphodiesterase
MEFDAVKSALWEKREKKGILIAAHRGTCGGNIVRNTIPAFENALKHGADIIELDVIMSKDGDFFVFHNGNEERVLGEKKDIREMRTKEIERHRCKNDDAHRIDQKVERLDEVLEYLKHKCLLNVDRSWFYWKETIAALKRHGMADQIILKSPADRELIEALEDSGTGFMYMPIVYKKECLDLTLAHKVNVIAAELILGDPSCELISADYMAWLKGKGIFSWVNAITLDDETVLSAGLDDNRSIIRGEDEGWGRLIELGFDIVQTDWPLLLRRYVDRRKANSHIE